MDPEYTSDIRNISNVKTSSNIEYTSDIKLNFDSEHATGANFQKDYEEIINFKNSK
ncbi:6811_t:CDS:2 [Dentiscutata heterogama]|uniref:6811_t:CDS:1 n=1 Tax=Dentiscutata heterogama TaxID=1316150 RepID=A0ACA9KXU7_9GLOM|nr:6811_t:CDS:2 [Dentiscutata heterogama]